MGRRETVTQSDFAFGELSDSYAASNVEAKAKSLKKGTNVRILNSYAIGQRPGSRRMATAPGPGIVAEFITSDDQSYIAIVRAGGADIYNDGGLIQSVEGAPWTAAEAQDITWHAREDTVYLSHQSYWPRVLVRTAGVWAFSLFDFDGGAGNSILQPYYRFAAAGISVTPSALTGAINVVFSAPVLQANHVGVRFRYGGSAVSLKEFQIVTVNANGINGTATVIDKLPPTFDVTVTDGSGFREGENVAGHDSGATGIATAVVGNVVTVLMSDGYESFYTGASAELLVGPFTSSKITGVAAAGAPAASTVWDEAVFSPVRGYPGDVFERSGRLGFADLPQIPGGIIMSAPGARSDFDVGKGEAQDGIFWLLADGGQRVLYCVSSSNLIILTDRRVYYVAEDQNAPLAANTFVPIEIGPTGSSTAFPITVEEGLVYVEAGGNRIMGVLSTGNLTAPFQLTDLSRHASHLIKNPLSLSMTNGNAQAPERYIFALNEDGTLTCIFFDSNPARLGMTPWETAGAYLAMVTIRGIIYALCQRTLAGSTRYLLERLDVNAQLDASALFTNSGGFAPLTDEAGDSITDDAGDAILTDIGVLPHLAGETVKLIRGTQYLGEFTVSADGSIPGVSAADGAFEAGLHFDMAPVLWPPQPADDQRTMFARRRPPRVAVRVKDSCVYTVGLYGRGVAYTRPAYDQGDDVTAAPPIRSEVKRPVIAGYEYEPSIAIGRPLPQPLTILSVAHEVEVTW